MTRTVTIRRARAVRTAGDTHRRVGRQPSTTGRADLDRLRAGWPTGRRRRPARRRLPHGRQPDRPAAARGHARPAWSGSPSSARATTPCSTSWPRRSARGSCACPRRTDDVARQLDEYFAGRRRAFDVPVDLQLVRGFRRDVIAHLPDIAVRLHRELRRRRRGRRAPDGRARRRQRLLRTTRCRSWCRATGSCAATARIGQYLRRRRGQGGAARPGGGGVTAADRSSTARRRARLGGGGGRARRRRRRRRRHRSSTPAECRGAGRPLRRRRPLPLDRRHGPPPLRPGPVPLLRPPAARRRGARCGPRSGRTCCRSPATGPTGAADRRRGPTTSTSGSTHCHAAGQDAPRRR